MATTRTHRPHRVITFSDGEEFTQEYGRRKGLHTHKSQTTDLARRLNRRDRRNGRDALRRGDWDVELPQPRGRALWLSY